MGFGKFFLYFLVYFRNHFKYTLRISLLHLISITINPFKSYCVLVHYKTQFGASVGFTPKERDVNINTELNLRTFKLNGK